MNLLDHMILWSLWFRFLLEREDEEDEEDAEGGGRWVDVGFWGVGVEGMEGWRDDEMMRWELILCNEW